MKRTSRKQLSLTSETLRALTAGLDTVGGGQRTSVGGPCVSLDGGSSCCSIYSKCASLCCL